MLENALKREEKVLLSEIWRAGNSEWKKKNGLQRKNWKSTIVTRRRM